MVAVCCKKKLVACFAHVCRHFADTTYLVGHEGREVRLLGRVILGERTDVPAVLLRAFLGQEPEGSVAGGLKFTVRHGLLRESGRVVWTGGAGGEEEQKVEF